MFQNGDVAMNLIWFVGRGSDVCRYLHSEITDRLLIKKNISSENGNSIILCTWV